MEEAKKIEQELKGWTVHVVNKGGCRKGGMSVTLHLSKEGKKKRVVIGASNMEGIFLDKC